MTVVGDTSVLIPLSRIDRFGLLRRLYFEITVLEVERRNC